MSRITHIYVGFLKSEGIALNDKGARLGIVSICRSDALRIGRRFDQGSANLDLPISRIQMLFEYVIAEASSDSEGGRFYLL